MGSISGSGFPTINPGWIEAVTASANSPRGRVVMTEHSVMSARQRRCGAPTAASLISCLPAASAP